MHSASNRAYNLLSSCQVDASHNTIRQGEKIQIPEISVQRFCRQKRIKSSNTLKQHRHRRRTEVQDRVRPRQSVITHQKRAVYTAYCGWNGLSAANTRLCFSWKMELQPKTNKPKQSIQQWRSNLRRTHLFDNIK